MVEKAKNILIFTTGPWRSRYSIIIISVHCFIYNRYSCCSFQFKPSGQKYYMKFLSQLAKQDAANVSTCTAEQRSGGVAHSKQSLNSWNASQQEKTERLLFLLCYNFLQVTSFTHLPPNVISFIHHLPHTTSFITT